MAAAGGGRTRARRARAEGAARSSRSNRTGTGSPTVTNDGEEHNEHGNDGESEALSEDSRDDDDEGMEDDDEENDENEDDDDEDDEDADVDPEEEEDDDDDDESPFRFLERLDPNWLARRPYSQASLSAQAIGAAGVDGRSPAGGTDDAEFYAAMIQMLTHVLGSSDSIAWANQATPGSQLAPSPFAHPQSSPAPTPNQAGTSHGGSSRSTAFRNKNELSALQPLIQALIARLGKDQQVPRRPVGEQDLTALLQTLMEQQQRQQDQQNQRQSSGVQTAQVYAPPNYQFAQPSPATQAAFGSTVSRANPPRDHAGATFSTPSQNVYQPLHFADLDFEDEDEDDPDFNPDLNPDLPLPTAWSLAVRDVVASEKSRAAAAAAAASHSGTPSGAQTPADVARRASYRESDPHPSAHLYAHASSFNAQVDRPPAAELHPPATASTSEVMEGSGSGEDRDHRVEGGSAAADARSRTQSEPEPSIPRKRGRKPVLEPGEAQRRRAQRNIEYQRMRRQSKKAEESEQSEAVLELRAEVRMLRAEMERLRDENAMLRAQRELERLQRSSSR